MQEKQQYFLFIFKIECGSTDRNKHDCNGLLLCSYLDSLQLSEYAMACDVSSYFFLELKI